MFNERSFRKKTIMILLVFGLSTILVKDAMSYPDLKLPFEKGQAWQCTQGNWDDPKAPNRTHKNGTDDKYAWDFSNGKAGDPILAPANGIVIEVRKKSENAYGLFVVIQYSDSDKGFFAHMQKTYVEINQDVIQGQPLGEVGDTGWDHFQDKPWGAHIHYTTRDANNNPKRSHFADVKRNDGNGYGVPCESYWYVSENSTLNPNDPSFQKFRDLVELYLSSPYPNTRYFNGKARDLVGNPLYEQRENGNKYQEYWSFLIPTDKGWSLCITYAPGAIPSEDKYLAPYPVAIHPELVDFYKANRSSLGSALCDTILGRFDGIVELPC